MYYDGCALVVCNGDVLAQGSQFSLDDIVRLPSINVVELKCNLGSGSGFRVPRRYSVPPRFGYKSWNASDCCTIVSSSQITNFSKRSIRIQIEPSYHSFIS